MWILFYLSNDKFCIKLLTATNQIILWRFWNITCIFTTVFKMICPSTFYPPLTLNCGTVQNYQTHQLSTLLPLNDTWSHHDYHGNPSLPNIIIGSIIGANTLRFSSTSCLYFLSHSRLISWPEPLIWEKIASSLGRFERWRYWKDSFEGWTFFFLSSQWALK